MPSYKNDVTGKWYCKFYYQDWNGERKQKKKSGFSTKRDAKEWERTFLSKYSGSSDILFKDLANIFLEQKKSTRRARTCITYDNAIKNHLVPYFGDIQVVSITPNQIREFRNQLMTKKLSKTTQNFTNLILSMIFNFAVRYYGLNQNPCKLCERGIEKETPEMKYWTLDEFNRFMMYVDKKQYKVIYTTLFYTGLRAGELLALTVEDIDLENKTIRVNKSLSRLFKEDIINPPKTKNSNRSVPIPSFLVDMLRDYINALYEPTPTTRLFTFTRHGILSYLHRIAKKYNLKQIRLHDFRHSHASLLINQGIPIFDIAKRLGHEDIKMTLNTYSHLYPDKEKEITNLLDKLNANS